MTIGKEYSKYTRSHLENMFTYKLPFLVMTKTLDNDYLFTISKRFGATYPSIHKTIKFLEENGLIIRATNQFNKKNKIIKFTEKGQKIREDMIAIKQVFDEIELNGGRENEQSRS